MKCPNCQKNLTPHQFEKTEVDVCENGCGGIWFDRFELKRFDEVHELNLETLLKTSKASPVDPSQRYNCPRCQTFIMMRNLSGPNSKVTVDVCPNCAGTWLDSGELSRIRAEYPTEAARIKAAENLFESILKKHKKSWIRHNEKIPSDWKTCYS